ncbi:hypothetical protein EC968_003413 [Mortierella alpina]|nr:hypothetical protein EC968_003413 [Mortierella alpina]
MRFTQILLVLATLAILVTSAPPADLNRGYHGPLPKVPWRIGKLQLGAIVFPGVDLLDTFRSQQQVKITPDYTIKDAPKMDIIFIPGGFGYGNITNNPEVHKHVETLVQKAKWCFTVCNGAGILATTGRIDGYNATTNKNYFKGITELGPKVNWIKRARWVQDGKFVTSSGVSAGMDAAVYVISQLANKSTAEWLSATMEYTWHRKADEDPFADLYPDTRS